MKYILKAYSIKEQGPRPKQEDSSFPVHGMLNESDRLFIVCDGMGGHSAGEVASSTVCEALGNSILRQCPDAEGSFCEENFKTALSEAFDELDTKDNGAAKKMGTTMTFLKLHDQGATIAHIGDSRVYHIRPGVDAASTEILFQTSDHSLVNDLVKIGELTPEEAKHSKQKNIITRAMQPNMERRPKADIYHTADIRPGDYFMLCSDGILEQMEDDNIKYIFSPKVKSDADKVKMIIDVTAQNHDNHTAILVHIMDVIDPIPVFRHTAKPEAEPLTGPKFNDTFDIEKEHDDNKGKKGILNMLTIALVCIFLGGAFVYTFTSGDEEKEAAPTSENTAPGNNTPANATANNTDSTDDNTGSNEEITYEIKVENNKFGFVDKDGNVIIECKYDAVQPFVDGKAKVLLNGKWGFIDKSGNVVVPFKYDFAWNFSEGLAVVELDGKWGFIDKSGNVVVPCKYDGAGSFSEGLASVELDGREFYIDKNGNEIK